MTTPHRYGDDDDIAFKVRGDFTSFEKDAADSLKKMSDDARGVFGRPTNHLVAMQIERLKIENQILELQPKKQRSQQEELIYLQKRADFVEKVVRLEQQGAEEKQAATRVASPASPVTPGARFAQGMRWAQAGVEIAASMQQASHAGFHGSSLDGVAADAARGIGRAAGVSAGGSLIGEILDLFRADEKRTEDATMTRLRIQQMVGSRARESFDETQMGRTFWDNVPGYGPAYGSYERMGLGREDMARLTVGAGRQGLESRDTLRSVAGMESWKLLGRESTDLMGAARRSGVAESSQQIDILGDAIGIALGTKLDEGRWGELLAVLAKSATTATGVLNQKNLIEQENFVQGLGPAFQGNTAAGQAARSFNDALRTGGAGPLANTLSLMAGMRRGESYNEAWYKQQTGERDVKDVLAEIAAFPEVKAAWESGDEEAKRTQLRILAPGFGVNPGILKAELDKWFGSGFGAVSADGRNALEEARKNGKAGAFGEIKKIAVEAAAKDRVNRIEDKEGAIRPEASTPSPSSVPRNAPSRMNSTTPQAAAPNTGGGAQRVDVFIHDSRTSLERTFSAATAPFGNLLGSFLGGRR